MKFRLSLAGALLLTPALGLLSAVPAGAAESSVDAEFTCTSVTVTSDRHDLSNVVLRFVADGGDQKFDGLTGRTGTFSGTGDHADDQIEGVFIKAGSNASGEGPGYGEFVDAPDSCDTASATGAAPASNDEGDLDGAAKGNHTGTSESGTNEGSNEGSNEGDNEGGDAVVGAVVSCDGASVVVTSTKDLSNVVLVLSDDAHVKHDGLSGHEQTFSAPAGTTITAVYVKSGDNHSGDGPGYGQRVDTTPCTTTASEVIVSGSTVSTGSTGSIVPAVANVEHDALRAAVAANADEAQTPAAAAAGANANADAAGTAGTTSDEALVMGVSLERSAPAAAAAGLARTGIELTTMVLVALSLVLGGTVLTRRGAAKRSA